MASTNSTQSQPLLQTTGLSKMFGDFTACDHIDLAIAGGEVHALVGENGAGKSTLVKMLFGVLEPSAGTIAWRGQPVTIASPNAARRTGIGMVFQHFSLFEALTVAENIALSFPADVSLAAVAEQTLTLSKAYGLPLDPHAHVADLSVGERQRIEIVRTLLQKPDLIILDEPTSVLTPQEADRMFELLEQLQAEGKSVLYISHRLDEVRRICDTATVLRHGQVTGRCDPRQKTSSSLAQMMMGTAIDNLSRVDLQAQSTVLLEARALQVAASSPFATALNNINLQVHAGEIVAIAGVAGNGQSELFDSLSGEKTVADAASVRINDTDAGHLGISRRRLLNAGFVPEERNGHAAIGTLPLSENIILARHTSDASRLLCGGLMKILKRSTARQTAARICSTMDVRKSGDNPPAAALSGGNLQKFIIGRELDRHPRVLVVNQPTWGVDAGAASHIRQALIDLARNGSAVLVISQDLDEIFEIATRIAVINNGELSAPEPAAAMSRERIGLLMLGQAGGSDGSNDSDSNDGNDKRVAHAH